MKNVYTINELNEFIEHFCSTGACPRNNILTKEQELKAEIKACKSDKTLENV